MILKRIHSQVIQKFLTKHLMMSIKKIPSETRATPTCSQTSRWTTATTSLERNNLLLYPLSALNPEDALVEDSLMSLRDPWRA